METAKSFDVVFSRLLVATNSKNESEFARAIGITPQSVNGARKRGKVPPDWIQSVAEKYDASSDWLFFGRGEGPTTFVSSSGMVLAQAGVLRAGDPIAHPQGQPVPGAAEMFTVPDANGRVGCDLVMVPKVRARLCAGGGSFETDGELVAHYAFRSDWIYPMGRPRQMILMDVSGDSMDTTIQNRDTVLIDRSQIDIIDGAIYAIALGETITVKRILIAPGKIVLSCDNRNYSPTEIAVGGDEMQQIKIIGRVVWWCREAG